MKPKVSIVIPCFNNTEYLTECIASANAQLYENKEIIVVDDGSNKYTKKLIDKLRSEIDMLVIQDNLGAGAARNAGISIAKGKYILNLDSDDYFESEFCDKAVKILENNSDVKVVTCYSRWFSEYNEIIFKPTGGGISNYLLKDCAMASAMFRKEDWGRVGGYDEQMLKGFEDWEFYIRLHLREGITHVIREVLFNYRNLEISNTTLALEHKYENLKYIYSKHADIYKENFEIFVDFILNKLEITEKIRDNRTSSLDYKIGRSILKPFRFLKSFE